MGVSIRTDGWNESQQGWDIIIRATWSTSLGSSMPYTVEAYHGGWKFIDSSFGIAVDINGTYESSVRLLGLPPYFKVVVNVPKIETITYNIPPHKNHYWDEYYPTFRPAIQHQTSTYNSDETWCCVCNAITAGREKIEYDIRGLTYSRYSVGWLYGNVNRNVTNEFAGMRTVDALNVLKNDGLPYFTRVNGGTVKKFPDVYKLNDYGTYKGAKTLYSLNQNNPSTRYGRIDSHEFKEITNVLSIMNNIKNSRQAVIMSIVISTELDQAHSSTSGICGRLSKTSSNRGNHVILIVGWKKINDEYYWICHNSWGQNSGDGGLLYVPVSWCYNSAYPQRGIVGYDIMYGGDYGTDKFDWSTQKLPNNQTYNKLSASDWNNITTRSENAYRWGYKEPTPLKRVSIGETMSADIFNGVRGYIFWAGFTMDGIYDINPSYVNKNQKIEANNHINKIRNSINFVH